MTTFKVSAPAAQSLSRAPESRQSVHRLGRLTGLLFIFTSIPLALLLYTPALQDPSFVLGGSFDAGVAWGALMELLLVLANIGTALALYPVLRRRFAVLPLPMSRPVGPNPVSSRSGTSPSWRSTRSG
jgi:hypothetical protein